ncbi:SCP2 sterol-binding domain-containing protein [Profundibacterium mesophilum]|uniref:Sterol carrier protein 2 n=1 Tax=Profundibacterium mesophilum KAUST100406-0324 TaxID=1037889 RepID=A0A921NRH9_9RHOB|nr:SCP2 sterol-binding domain-containing protein [Profundibacterium mesophilum]KAF0674959.1 sterol carrier protein 2 [Profundibacterium mesophilum KAUST100406-0324]
MSDLISQAVSELNTKLGGSFDGSARFVIEDEGTIMMDEAGARAEDGEADVTLSADAETFKEILDGALNPTTAFMSGKLSVDGDMGTAMKLAGALS